MADKRPKEFDIETGIEETIKRIDQIGEAPVFVSIWGNANSGKSYLITQLGSHYEGNGLKVARNTSHCHPHVFKQMKETAETFGFKDIYFFHSGPSRLMPEIEDEEDPDVLLRNILGKRVHLNIGIYNPRFYNGVRGEYDLTISNPGSTEKTHLNVSRAERIYLREMAKLGKWPEK